MNPSPTSPVRADHTHTNDRKLYASFGVVGFLIGICFPIVAQFFVIWREGMLYPFVGVCIGAGLLMAGVAAVSVRTTIVQTVLDREAAEREERLRLQKALHEYMEFARRVAAGEMTVRLSARQDAADDVARLGSSLNEMVGRLHEVTRQLAEASGAIDRSSSSLLTSSTEQSAAASQQATAVAEIATTLEEVRLTSEQAAERAQSVIDVTERAQGSYESGIGAVDNASQSIRGLRSRVESIADSILKLSEKTQQIGEIVETVSELAERSNLLAINAAIEAAKAGEQGRGFAVVASHVRGLAEQSKQATRQVRAIIGDIQRATNTAVMVTEEGVKQADGGVELTRGAGEELGKLAKMITDSVQAARQIAALSRQQSLGMEQVSTAMRSIQQASKSSADGIREVERATRDLRQLSQGLSGLVAHQRA